MNCWSCGQGIDPQDHYCRHCGQGQGAFLPWYYHPFGIAFLTVFLLGPFSLYLVWKSPRMSERGRWIGTLLVAAFTAYLAFSIFAAMRMLRTALSGAF